jgi:large subunit ribosomal protein L23
MRNPREVVIRPLLTEKSTILKENQNQVLFQVAPDANKVEIRHAVEAIFNVKVRDVRTIVMEGKLKRMGKFQGRRPGWKKAIISLQPGHKIDLVEGA